LKTKGIPAIFWNSTHWVKFIMKIGAHENFLVFLEDSQISFMSDEPIEIPLALHGNGVSRTLLEYFANNTNDNYLITKFLNYYIDIMNFRYYDVDEKLIYEFGNSEKWQENTFIVGGVSDLSKNQYVVNNYIDNYYI